jgi:hypothetical protein
MHFQFEDGSDNNRAHSAPDPIFDIGTFDFENDESGSGSRNRPGSPEDIVKQAIKKARGKAGKNKKISESEKRLMAR